MSLERARQILSMRPEVENPYYPKILSMQTSIIASVLSTQTKTDETMLRSKTDNKFDRLIELVRQQQTVILEAKPKPRPSINWTDEPTGEPEERPGPELQ